MNSSAKQLNRLVLSAATFFCVASSQASSPSIIVNGSFESAPGGSYPIYPGSTSLTGWTILTGSVDSVDSFQAHDGVMSVDLDGFYQVGAISQDVAVAAGQSYVLSFWMAGNPEITSPAPIKTLQLFWGGVSQGTFSFDVTGHTYSDMGWVQHQLVLPATGPLMNLKFASLSASGSAFGPMIDDVSLTLVPEPSTISLLATGLAVVLIRKKRLKVT